MNETGQATVSEEIAAILRTAGTETAGDNVPRQQRGNPNLGQTDKASEYDGPNSEIPDAFANVREPQVYLKHENHRHRLIIMLAASGHNIKEIAEIVGYTTVTVSNVLRQPWAVARLTNEIRDGGRDALRKVIEGASMGALLSVIEISQNTALKAEIRLKANDSILDRFMGKASQPLTVETEKNLENLTDQQLATIAARSRSSSVTAPPT